MKAAYYTNIFYEIFKSRKRKICHIEKYQYTMGVLIKW